MAGTAGIIANPASGRDIRRLVAHASVFNNFEKINIVRRVLNGLAAAGVDRVLYMPDSFHICEKAADGLHLPFPLQPVIKRIHASAEDTTAAAAAMEQAGVDVVVSLGGDGTNRALAKGSHKLPLVAVSTGTNNVFPVMIEGTVAGLAAGAVAVGAVDLTAVARPCKWVEVAVDGVGRDVALIDAVVMADGFVGSRAIWEIENVKEVVLTRAVPDAIGMAAVGGMVLPTRPDEDGGVHLTFGPGGSTLAAAIAPGLIREVPLARACRLGLGDMVAVTGPALVALDGEREFRLGPDARATFYVTRSGPPVVDISRCLAAAWETGFLRRD